MPFLIKQIIWGTLGTCTSLLTVVGILLPIVPQIPFFIATVYCFSKCSPKFKAWIEGTKLYAKTMGKLNTKKKSA